MAALGLAVQQLLVEHLALLLPAALLLQLLELQVFKELGLRLQGLRFLCRTRLLRGGSLSKAGQGAQLAASPQVWGEPGSSRQPKDPSSQLSQDKCQKRQSQKPGGQKLSGTPLSS